MLVLRTIAMVVSCSARGCKNRGGQFDDNGVKIGWHRFPHRDPELLAKWAEAMDRPGWRPSDSSHVCSCHFVAKDYVYCPGAKSKRLKPEIFPTVFNAGTRLNVPLGSPEPPSPLPPTTTEDLSETENNDYLIPEVQYSEQDSTTTLSFTVQPNEPASESSKREQSSFPKKRPVVKLKLQEAPPILRRVPYRRPAGPRPFQQPHTSQRKVAIEHDHQYSQDNFLSTSCRSDQYVTKLEESVRKLTDDVARLKKEAVLLKQANQRKSRAIATLNRRIAELALTVSQQQQGTGAENLSRLMQMLLHNGQRNASRVAQGRQYTKEMRQFCRTVHHFSPPAYRFLKEELYLPDPRSLRKWASEVSAEANKDFVQAGGFAEIDFSHLEDGPDEAVPVASDPAPAVADSDFASHMVDAGSGLGAQQTSGVLREVNAVTSVVPESDIDFSHLEDDLEEGVPAVSMPDFCRISM